GAQHSERWLALCRPSRLVPPSGAVEWLAQSRHFKRNQDCSLIEASWGIITSRRSLGALGLADDRGITSGHLIPVGRSSTSSPLIAHLPVLSVIGIFRQSSRCPGNKFQILVLGELIFWNKSTT